MSTKDGIQSVGNMRYLPYPITQKTMGTHMELSIWELSPWLDHVFDSLGQPACNAGADVAVSAGAAKSSFSDKTCSFVMWPAM